MRSISAALFSLFVIRSIAAPQSPSHQARRSPDACGPTIQERDGPPDTCNAKPPTVNKAVAFGVVGNVENLRYDWSSCDPTVLQICKTLAKKDTVAGRWYFETGPGNYPEKGDPPCQMGFWLPRDDIEPPSKSSDIDAAPKPSEHQCQIIFNATVDAAKANYPNWLSASVNLLTNPANQPGQWDGRQALPNGTGTGMEIFPLPSVGRTIFSVMRLLISVGVLGSAFNAGYPSYVIAGGLELPPLTGIDPAYTGCEDDYGSECPCALDGIGCEG
ncbi:MAG: hypothetical protein L6R40_001970 [Gallowayella cf. fulva]|nr:MAG: hypothetical protein L6R40_001970 [Xanthomendoza cf. fulva]